MYKFAILLLVLTCMLLPAAEPDTSPGNHDVAIKVGDLNRTYWVHVPTHYDRAKPMPLLVVLPWGRGISNFGDDQMHFIPKADRENILLVYAQASKECGGWAAYMNCDPKLEPKGSMAGKISKWADEGAYFRALLEEVQKNYAVDPKRVFLAGTSGGGLMAYRVATLLADKITGVCSISGNFVWRNEYPQEDPPKPSRPVSFIAFHGDQDKNVSYTRASNANITVWSAHESTGFWVKANGCKAEPETTTLTGAAVSGCTVKVEHWTGSASGASVALYTKVGGVHETPPYVNELMWSFFVKEAEARIKAEAAGTAKGPADK